MRLSSQRKKWFIKLHLWTLTLMANSCTLNHPFMLWMIHHTIRLSLSNHTFPNGLLKSFQTLNGNFCNSTCHTSTWYHWLTYFYVSWDDFISMLGYMIVKLIVIDIQVRLRCDLRGQILSPNIKSGRQCIEHIMTQISYRHSQTLIKINYALKSSIL